MPETEPPQIYSINEFEKFFCETHHISKETLDQYDLKIYPINDTNEESKEFNKGWSYIFRTNARQLSYENEEVKKYYQKYYPFDDLLKDKPNDDLKLNAVM